jgi:hypothetical protein
MNYCLQLLILTIYIRRYFDRGKMDLEILASLNVFTHPNLGKAGSCYAVCLHVYVCMYE